LRITMGKNNSKESSSKAAPSKAAAKPKASPAKATPKKASPAKSEPKKEESKPKAEPKKAEPKVEPKAEPKVEAKEESKVEEKKAEKVDVVDDPSTIEDEELTALFAKLTEAKDATSLLKKYLTKDVFDALKNKKTALGCDLKSCVRSGCENLDSGIGVYASDADAYVVFADLLNRVICDYHKIDSLDGFKHPSQNFAFDDAFTGNVDETGEFVLSTRIRVARNVAGYPLRGGMDEKQTIELEQKVKAILEGLEDEDLKGKYHPLEGMDEKTRAQLVADHFLFKKGDRFLASAGINNFWPKGRGIFFNDAKTFLVWINEEDALRIISMEQGGNVKAVFNRLEKAVNILCKKLDFAFSPQLGYLTACPTNIGCGERASVHIKLPLLSTEYSEIETIATKFNLQIRGVHGEHSESKGGVYDVSNKRRLGITEWDGVKDLVEGTTALIAAEKALQSAAEEAANAEVAKAEAAEEEKKQAEQAAADELKAEEAKKVEAARVKAEAEQAEAEKVKAELEEAERVKAEAAEAERVKAEEEKAAADKLKAEEEAEAAKLKAEAEEAERVKAEAEEAERVKAEEAEVARVKAEAEEAERVKAEAEEAERVKEEAEVARVKAEAEEAERVKAEEEAARVKAEEEEKAAAEAEEEKARLKAEEEEKEKEAEAERVKAEEEAAQVKAEEEKAAAEEEAARVKAEEEKAAAEEEAAKVEAEAEEPAAEEEAVEAEADADAEVEADAEVAADEE